MFYREAGQFKTSYRSRSGDLPDRAGPLVRHPDRRVRLPGDPVHRRPVPLYRSADPGADPVARRDRAEHPDRLLRAAFAWHRRLHGGRRLRLLQSAAALSRIQPDRRVPVRRADGDAGRRSVRHPVAAHQGLLPRGRDAGLAVLPRMGVRAGEMVHQLRALRLGRGRQSRPVRFPDPDADAEVFVRAGAGGGAGARRQELDPRPAWPHVDGDARHGHRRRDHRHSPAACQAVRIRGVVVLHWGRRRAVGVPAARLVGAARVRHQPLVPDPVHGHHRRTRLDPGLVPGRRLHRADADLSQSGSWPARHPDCRPR